MNNSYDAYQYSQPDPYASGRAQPYQQPTNYSQGSSGYSQPAGEYAQPQYQQAPTYRQPIYGQPIYQQPAIYGQPIYGQPVYPQPVVVIAQEPPTNGKATAALVLGIISYIGFSILTGIPAVIMGHLALKEIQNSRGTQGGRSLAIVGLVLGYISIGLVVLVCFYLTAIIGIFSAVATHP